MYITYTACPARGAISLSLALDSRGTLPRQTIPVQPLACMVMGESSRGAGAVNKFLLRSPLTVMSCHVMRVMRASLCMIVRSVRFQKDTSNSVIVTL